MLHLCLLLSVLMGTPDQAPLRDIVFLDPQHGAAVEVGDGYRVRIYAMENDALRETLLTVAPPGPLRVTLDAPTGPVQVPGMTLVGGERKRLFFVSHQKLFWLYERASETWTHWEAYTSPSTVHVAARGDAFLLTSGLVTVDNAGCASSFFALKDAKGETLDCFGMGKPFLETFTGGDFPAAFTTANPQKCGIYYKKSGDLFWIENGRQTTAHIDQTHLTTLTSAPTPEWVYGLTHQIALVKILEKSAHTFTLKNDTWLPQTVVPGTFTKGVCLDGLLLLLTQDGHVQTAHPTH